MSKTEIYSLLLGVLLHDIGMQCDDRKHSSVLQLIKEKYNKKFSDNFSNSINGELSQEQQAELRENHQLFTASWIELAYKNKLETSLGEPISKIPDNIIADVIDICMYHSKLDINKCEKKFRYIGSGRKQLIAVLVRFGDELDIGRDRVSMQTVIDFSLPGGNSIFWHLHNNTIIDINENEINENEINALYRLNPDDYLQYG